MNNKWFFILGVLLFFAGAWLGIYGQIEDQMVYNWLGIAGVLFGGAGVFLGIKKGKL